MDKEHFENFQPLDFLNLAKKSIEYLERNSWNNSSLERTIFGRVYYGTFLYVREWLSKNTLDFIVKNNGKDHKNIPRYIQSKGPFDKCTNKLISDNLKKLRKLRNQADYNLVVPDKSSKEFARWDNSDVNNAVDLAEDIINSFDSI